MPAKHLVAGMARYYNRLPPFRYNPAQLFNPPSARPSCPPSGCSPTC